MTKDQLQLPEIDKDAVPTTRDYVYERLRAGLLGGHMVPGEAVTIRGIATAFETSPTPVREALRQLGSIGALDVLENRRVIVPDMSYERFVELVNLRIALEIHAATSVLAHISNGQIAALEALDRELDEVVESGELAGIVTGNQAFHRTLYEINPHQASLAMIEGVWLQLGPFMRLAIRHLGKFYVVDRHKEIIAALYARDEKALKAAIRADISDAVGRLDKTAFEHILSDASPK